MSADSKTGLAPGDASEIEDVTRNAGHDAEGEMTNSGDAWKEPDVGSVNIEKVAQLDFRFEPHGRGDLPVALIGHRKNCRRGG
jgi:hypothetical protein